MNIQTYRTMKIRNCYVFVFEGYADWQLSLTVAGLNQFTDFNVRTVALEKKLVRSAGNTAIMPDSVLDDIDINRVDLLLLPGGHAWDAELNQEIHWLVDAVLNRKNTVAALDTATLFMAQRGYLDNIRHTSNNLEYYLLKSASNYNGAEWFVDEPAVLSNGIITAKGTATIEVAELVFKHVGVLHDERLRFWFDPFLKPQFV